MHTRTNENEEGNVDNNTRLWEFTIDGTSWDCDRKSYVNEIQMLNLVWVYVKLITWNKGSPTRVINR